MPQQPSGPFGRRLAFRYPSRRPAAADFLMLTTMYAPPRLPVRPVPRPRLNERLAAGVRQTPLTLVSAPAGSGKTTLAASWMEHPGVPWRVVWLTLSEATESPEEFWFFATEALARAGVDLPHATSPAGLQAVQGAFVTRLATDLLDRDEPVALVLDEVERLTDPTVPGQLELLLRLATPRIRLVLVSRIDPLLPMQRYRMAGTMTEIRMADLAFTPQEARSLFVGHDIDVSAGTAEALVSRTEGWAAGLQLAALTLQHVPVADREASAMEWLRGPQDANLAEYLTGEVLNAQPPHLREFLLRTCVVDTVSADLAEELTGEVGAAMALVALARANILMEAVGDLPGCYRAHPLFRELLRAQLAYLSPGLIPELHLRAARWFHRAGMVEQAVAHYGAAGAWEEAATLVVDGLLVGEILRPSAHGLAQRLSGMPGDTPGSSAAVVRAAVASGQADPRACDAALAAAEAVPADRHGPALEVAVTATRLALAASHADPEETLLCAERAEKALSALPGDANGVVSHTPESSAHPELLVLLLSTKGAAQLQTGDLSQASQTLADAVDASAKAGFQPEHRANLGRLALAEALRGRLRRARELVEGAGQPAEGGAGAVAQRPAAVVVADAWLQVEAQDLEAARRTLARSTVPAEPQEQAMLEGLVGVLRARTERARGELAAALQAVDRPAPRLAWLRELVDQERVLVHLAAGQPEKARRVIASAPAPPSRRLSLLQARVGLALGEVAVTGRLDPATIEHADDVPLDLRVDAWLVEAQSCLSAGQRDRAVTAIRRAVHLARPEAMRRPFHDAAKEVRRALRATPPLADAASWLSSSSAPRPYGHIVPMPKPRAAEREPIIVDALSPRETEVLRHLADLLTTEEVAATMFVSVNTVKSHIRSILRKLSVSRRNEAIRRARDLEVI
jgi:LuxR family transcriptional regulator, maltose regulon positive regulatory protein